MGAITHSHVSAIANDPSSDVSSDQWNADHDVTLTASDVGAEASGAVAAHEADTTAIHGITDTSALYTAGGTDVAVADGGTGASTAAAARTNLGLVAVAASGSASDLSAGTLPGARMPALTGDVTAAAGSTATTLAAGSASNLNSGTLPAARMPALTGDVTTSAGAVASTIAARAVSYAKMQAVSATSRILGRKTAAAGDIEEITAADVLDMLLTTRGDLPIRGATTTARAALGASGTVLGSDGTDASWRTVATVLAALLTTRGDIITRDASAVVRLALGSSGTLFRSNGTDAAWTALATVLADILTTRGDLVTRDGTGVVRKAVGTAYQRFMSDGTDPQWQSFKGWELARSANQLAVASTDTAITWPTETTDTDGFHAANASAVVIPTGMGGWYSLSAYVNFDVSSTAGLRMIGLRKNTTTPLSETSKATQSVASSLSIPWIGKLAAGDTVEVFYNTGTGTPNINPANFQGVFLGA